MRSIKSSLTSLSFFFNEYTTIIFYILFFLCHNRPLRNSNSYWICGLDETYYLLMMRMKKAAHKKMLHTFREFSWANKNNWMVKRIFVPCGAFKALSKDMRTCHYVCCIAWQTRDKYYDFPFDKYSFKWLFIFIIF